MKTDYNIFHSPVKAMPGKKGRMLLLIFCLFTSYSSLFSQENFTPIRWTDNTAYIMPAGKWESGIFQPFSLGLNNKIEIRSDVLLLPVLPNAGVKIMIKSGENLILSSEHSISFPSVFLNVVSFKGTGGLISPQYSFPFIMTFSNSIIATKRIGSSSLLTADIGLILALKGGKIDYQSSIDIPFIYQRMAHYFKGSSIRAGTSFKGPIVKNLYFEEGIRIFLITRKSENIFLENSGALLWSSRGSLRIKGGYLLSWGKYPFGNHLQLWPALDLIFGSRSKTKDQ